MDEKSEFPSVMVGTLSNIGLPESEHCACAKQLAKGLLQANTGLG